MKTTIDKLDLVVKVINSSKEMIELIEINKETINSVEVQRVLVETYNDLLSVAYPDLVKGIHEIKGLIDVETLDL